VNRDALRLVLRTQSLSVFGVRLCRRPAAARCKAIPAPDSPSRVVIRHALRLVLRTQSLSVFGVRLCRRPAAARCKAIPAPDLCPRVVNRHALRLVLRTQSHSVFGPRLCRRPAAACCKAYPPRINPHALSFATRCDWCCAHSRSPFLECGCVGDQPQQVATPNRSGLTLTRCHSPRAATGAPHTVALRFWSAAVS